MYSTIDAPISQNTNGQFCKELGHKDAAAHHEDQVDWPPHEAARWPEGEQEGSGLTVSRGR